MMRRRVVAGLLASISAFISGCSMSGLAFIQDERVDIVEPGDDRVRLPLTIRWDATNVEGSFAVIFDRSPMRPGQTVLALVPESDPCRSTHTCLDAPQLAERGVYVTTGHQVTVEQLRNTNSSRDGVERHDVTIVILDASGARVGESAFTREFVLERD